MRRTLISFLLGFLLFLPLISSAGFTGTTGAASFTSMRQLQPDFQTYYGDKVNTYWPTLDIGAERTQCEARQDLIIQVAPAGCQPAVVRSDLLAEQNVPVFCQLDALKLNPLIDISEITNLNFRANYPSEILSTGFHPARAALKTQDRLLGSPLTSNIGYAVVILRKNPNESSLPSSVNVTLFASIQYDSGNALGIGSAEFLLTPVSDEAWSSLGHIQNSFWKGQYAVRLEKVTATTADIGIYRKDQRISGMHLEKGKLSSPLYLPGGYCQAGLTASYDEYVGIGKKAHLEINDASGTRSVDVSEGSLILDGRCRVDTITLDSSTKTTGEVNITCKSGEDISLAIRKKFASFSSGDSVLWSKDKDKKTWTILESISDGTYRIRVDAREEVVPSGDLTLQKTPAALESDQAFSDHFTTNRKYALPEKKTELVRSG